MKTAGMVIGVVGIALIAFGARATAQMTLPEGPSRALVMRTCAACHDLGMVLGTGGRTRDGLDFRDGFEKVRHTHGTSLALKQPSCHVEN